MNKKEESIVVELNVTHGVDICFDYRDGLLEIASNMSEEDTKAALPQLFPSWTLK